MINVRCQTCGFAAVLDNPLVLGWIQCHCTKCQHIEHDGFCSDQCLQAQRQEAI